MTAPAEEPADLNSFWAGVTQEVHAVDPGPRLSDFRPLGADIDEPSTRDSRFEVADLHYRSLDGVEIGGWVVRPVEGADRVMVMGHGYGGRSAPTADGVPAGTLCLQPVARGIPARSIVPGIGDQDGKVPHVLWGIESPRTYSHVGSVADSMLAATIGQDLIPGATRLGYRGGSFGGGIGALVLAADERFEDAHLAVPSFGNNPWRATVRSIGSGEAVRQHLQVHPEHLGTIRYTDAASAARRVRIPVFVEVALADPFVPPPGQFAVALSFAGPTWVHVTSCGHAEPVGAEATAEHHGPDGPPSETGIREWLAAPS
jgi:cephalosporin-C deacetylase